MNRKIRAFLKRTLPKPILINTWATYSRSKSRQARQVFEAAADEPQWLAWKEFEQLQAEYPLPDQSYCYDSASLEERGLARARDLAAMAAKKPARRERFLDLGSWDGMTCYYLREMGKTAVGVDNRIDGFSKKAIAAGTPLAGMDASHLGFADNTFDFVFSYNSFEHFLEPDLVLREAVRVVRPGGQIFLSFGPLWLSPKGAHQFKSISVPYCECLFPVPLIEKFAQTKGLDLIDFGHMNRWTLTQYRDLWAACSDQLELVTNYETYNANNVELIMRYPSCFKSKTTVFDDLIVSNIDVLFVKR